MDPVKPSALMTEETQQFAMQMQPDLLPYLSAVKVTLTGMTPEEKDRKDPLKAASRGVPFALRNLFHFRNDPSKN